MSARVALVTRASDAQPEAKLVPMQRPDRPGELASRVVYLFREGADYTIGQVISVDGGVL